MFTAVLATPRQQMFLSNLCLLAGILVVLTVAIVLVIATWTGLKVGIWEFRRKRAERNEQRRKQLPDDLSSLQIGTGLCDHCCTPSSEVYHLPSGERCCRPCFQQFHRRKA